jgi:2-acylglycerol O-acyltransferase 1
MAIHVISMWWMPLLAVLILFIPEVRIPWLICMSYSLFTARNHEKSTLPLYYHLIRRTRLWDIYRSFYSDYYPVRLYRTSELSPTHKYVFGYHPHGVGIRGMGICFGMQAAGFPQLFPGLRTTFHVTSAAFKVPLWKSHLQLMGCKSVSRAGCEAQLTSGGHDGRGMGNGIIISVGGHREAERARPKSMDVVVKIRKGFVRLAVETGADIVPVIGFGENDIFEEPMHKGTFGERVWKSLCHFPSEINGEERRFSIGMPFRKPLHVVVGSSITVERQDIPDADYVNKLHGLYVQQLEEIWNDWRDQFGIGKSVEFRVVE